MLSMYGNNCCNDRVCRKAESHDLMEFDPYRRVLAAIELCANANYLIYAVIDQVDWFVEVHCANQGWLLYRDM